MSLVNGEHARVAQFLGLHMLGPDNFLSFKRDKDLKIESANQARDLIASVINGFTNMEALELCMNSIGVAASEVIGNALANKPELKACLFDDIFKQRTIPETGPALKNLLDGIQLAGARLVYLNLSDNALGPSVIEYYREFLQSEACFSLQYLNLNNCGMGSSILTVSDSLIECKRRAAAAGVQFQLRVFIAGRNRLEDPGAFALSRAFKELGTLQHVSLPQDGIRPDGIKALAKSFAANRDLRVIDIGDNCCNVSGAKAMCTVLQRLPFVEVLNFADCLFKTKGGTYFLEAMRSGLDNVREVNLSGNEIDANVAKQLLDCARQKVNLKQLRIGTNRFGRQLTEIRSVASGMGDLSVDVGESSDNEGTASEDGEEADESSAAQSADDLSDDPPPLLAAQIANALAQQHDQHQSSSGAHQNSAGGGSGVWSRLGPRVDASHSTHNGTHGFDESGEVSRLVGEVRLTGTRRVKRPAGPNARRFGPLRKTLSPGTVCILLAGRHKGKRVVYLKRMEKSGCMLVTGPHKLNNCPLRRIHQAYVIATKTKVDISGVQIPEHINDEYLKRAPRPKRNLGAAAEADIFAVKKREYVLSDQRKEDQKSVDKQVLAAVKEHKDAAMLKKYLKTGFGIKKSDAPHSMLF